MQLQTAQSQLLFFSCAPHKCPMMETGQGMPSHFTDGQTETQGTEGCPVLASLHSPCCLQCRGPVTELQSLPGLPICPKQKPSGWARTALRTGWEAPHLPLPAQPWPTSQWLYSVSPAGKWPRSTSCPDRSGRLPTNVTGPRLARAYPPALCTARRTVMPG